MSKMIFLSYRRNDSKDLVDRLESELKNKYGAEIDVFRDIRAIGPGDKFREKLEFAVSQSLVFLAIIGKEWAEPPGQQSRLFDPDDFVRREIEYRLKNWRSDIIPILVNGASIPHREQLPEKMRKLFDFNALQLRNEFFQSDLARLYLQLDEIFADDDQITSELDELEALERKETLHKGNNFESKPGPRVSFFPVHGKWSCDIKSPFAPDPITGQKGKACVEFSIDKESRLKGVFKRMKGMLFGIPQYSKDLIEGEAFLITERYASIHGGDFVDRIHFQGVSNGTAFSFQIPLFMKFGDVYHGRDGDGREYVLRLLEAWESPRRGL